MKRQRLSPPPPLAAQPSLSLPLNLILSISLELDRSEGDSLLSHAIASGRASYHHVDVRDKSLLTKGEFLYAEFLCISLRVWIPGK